MNTVIKNGIIVTSGDVFKSNLLIKGSKIFSFNKNNVSSEKDCKIIDAENCYVLPGFIDVHNHYNLPFCGTFSSDDFFSGSISLASGGTTSFIDFVPPITSNLIKNVEVWFKKASCSIIDYGFHCIIKEVNKNTKKQVSYLIDNGITSFKIFTAYPNAFMIENEDIIKIMKISNNTGALVCVHCENGEVINSFTKNLINNNFISPINHYFSRPDFLEKEAISRIYCFSKLYNPYIYIVHVSSFFSLNDLINDEILNKNIFLETCPQYLIFDSNNYFFDSYFSSNFIMSPPLRSKFNKNKLWSLINKEKIKVISSDHCSFFYNDQKKKMSSKFNFIPNGCSFGQNRAILLYNYGVLKNKISLNKWIDLLSVYPSKIFGLYPKKGTLNIGAYADVVIFDPNKKSVLSKINNFSNIDNEICDSTQMKGLIKYVISKGKIIFEKNKVNIESFKNGSFLKRKIPIYGSF